MTLLTDYLLISGSSKLTQFLLACMQVRYGLLPSYDKVERWITPYKIGFWQCWKGFSELETPFLHGALCENVAWSLCNSTGSALQCVCTILLLTQCNSSTMRKVLQADMQSSSWSFECWSSYILSPMQGLTQSYMLKQKLLNCEPIKFS